MRSDEESFKCFIMSEMGQVLDRITDISNREAPHH
jgi:hypothetical protein